MHILLVSAYFPPDSGSAANLFFELGNELTSLGHRVSIVTGFPGYHVAGDNEKYRRKLWMTERMEGLTVYRIAVPQVARDTAIGRGLWQFSCAASFALRGMFLKPDVALIYSPPLPIGLAGRVWKFFRRVPFVFNVQDLFPQSAIDLGVLTQKSLIRFFESLERKTYARANALTVHSDGNKEHVVRCGADRESVFTMHNFVNTQAIVPGDRDNAFRAKHGLQGKFVVSFAGVVGLSQDIDVILEAAAMLSDRDDIQFLLVGDGTEKKRLVEKTTQMGLGNVTWLPMLPKDEYIELLHASDVGLATLKGNVLTPVVPSKIMSIMAAGRPVIATMPLDGDAPKLIANAEAGYCFAAGDAESLTRSISEFADDADKCEKYGKKRPQICGRSFVDKCRRGTVFVNFQTSYRDITTSNQVALNVEYEILWRMLCLVTTINRPMLAKPFW